MGKRKPKRTHCPKCNATWKNTLIIITRGQPVMLECRACGHREVAP